MVQYDPPSPVQTNNLLLVLYDMRFLHLLVVETFLDVYRIYPGSRLIVYFPTLRDEHRRAGRLL
jgi:hypothetical protein